MLSLTVFNILGQQIAVLQNGEQEAGYHEVKFEGSGMSSGVYFYRISKTTSRVGGLCDGGSLERVKRTVEPGRKGLQRLFHRVNQCRNIPTRSFSICPTDI